MKKYIKLQKPEEWQLLYSPTIDTVMEIAKCIGEYIDSFHTKYYESFDPKSPIIDNDRLFVIKDYKGLSIWEIGNNIKDMNGSEIPNVYQVRRVGYIF